MRLPEILLPLSPPPSLPWVSRIAGVPYFQTEDGRAWHPIGQNDAITWPELRGLYRRRDPGPAEDYFRMQAAHGVTCMRLMLEYAQVRHRYFELAPGRWSPAMVRLWDDLFALAERYGIRLLITPFDTFWMWLKFQHHPYNSRHGGPLRHPSRALLSRATREAIKARLTFAAERWGGSGALFAWDLWNEIHPAQAQMSASPFVEFITDLSEHVRAVEERVHGRSHLQTVSLFGPELHLKPEMRTEMEHSIFRHPTLDFATIHVYEHGTIDDPKNTVDAAIGMGRVVAQSVAEITDARPFLDTEHGPIHSFKDHRRTLPEFFDDEYFRHMQWAHLASGGAGGGMRWPNRHPHSLTAGMRVAQRSLAEFLPSLDWLRFARRNVADEISILGDGRRPVSARRLARFACATEDQALVYLLRRDARRGDGHIDRDASLPGLTLRLPMLRPGRYRVTDWDTYEGRADSVWTAEVGEDGCLPLPDLYADMALAVVRVG